MMQWARTAGASAEIRDVLAADTALPFPIELSLAPLLAFWRRGFDHGGAAAQAVAELVQREIERAPELAGPIDDFAVIERHRSIVDLMMAAVFAPAFIERDAGAALVPFQLRAFWATPGFRAALMGEDGTLKARAETDVATMARIRRAFSYRTVLRKAYGLDVDFEIPFVFTATERATGLDRHFKIQFDDMFLEARAVGPLPPLPEDIRARPEAALVDPDRLAQVLPSDRFVISGFTVLRAVDVTDQEVLSSLKRDLIDKESIVAAARFAALQAKLQTLFRRPDLRFGLAALEGDRVLILSYTSRLEHSCIFADSAHHKVEEFEGSLYERTVQAGEPLIIEDLAKVTNRTCIDDAIFAAGIRSMLLAPLFYQERLIGVLKLASPTPGEFTAADLPKLGEVVPLFAVAVQRSMEEFNTRVQAFIKERFTAIHPVVEWRFHDAAMNHMDRRRIGVGAESDELEPIVFDNVYPLYGLADIRGSSTHRARAIQADLLTQ
ncbi:MAG: GAF domain-containing protein, partial [Candidatus Rokubacteria bacterium]|nr:GAF domain-containing protein [Candidatus Rokubacteria bacterium]